MPKSKPAALYALFHPIYGGIYTARKDALKIQKYCLRKKPIIKKFSNVSDADYFVEHGRSPLISRTLPPLLSTEFPVFTDGSCQQKGKAAGYGVFFGTNHPCNVSREFTRAPLTSNRAELTAIETALTLLMDPANKHHIPPTTTTILIYTDSEYSLGCLTTWRPRWEANDCKNIKNLDVIKPVWALIDQFTQTTNWTLILRWTPAHAGCYGNDEADRLARTASQRMLRGGRAAPHPPLGDGPLESEGRGPS